MRRYCYCKREGLEVHKSSCMHRGKPVHYDRPSAGSRERAEQRIADHIDGYDRDDDGCLTDR